LKFKCSKEFMAILDKIEMRETDLKSVSEKYLNLFCNKYYFLSLAKDVSLPDNMEEIFEFTQKNLQKSYMLFDDASVLAYLYLKNNEYNRYRHMKQVLIDEAQDYYPIHFEIFNIMFPKARYTILGDINQTIEKEETISFYDDIKDIYNRRKNSIVTLDKSFRCSNEILKFSSRFISADIKVFGRDGDEPQIYRLEKENSLDEILKEIEYCIEKGYKTIGVICKTEKESLELYKVLSNVIEVTLIKENSTDDLLGVFVLPIYLSKGLEFDASLIWGVDKDRYNSDDDKKLLYIGCTRALHRLGLFYYGELSPLC